MREGENMLKWFCYKRCILSILLGSIFLLSACGPQDDSSKETSTSVVEQESKEQSDEEVDEILNEQVEKVSESIRIPINTQEEEIPYISEDGIDPMRALHRCVSAGENVFLAYNAPDIYSMPIGAQKHGQTGITNPDSLNVCNVAVDTYGRIHLLMAGSDYEEWYIWQLDEAYQVDKVMNVSDYFETKQIPLWFLVDKEGNYYFQWPFDRNGMIVNDKGEMVHKLSTQTLEISWIYEAAVGKDGMVYLVFSTEDDQIKIGRLDVEKGCIDKENLSEAFPAQETFSLMAAGTDTNLLLYSPYSGIWACDMEKGIF